jgi:hypothetical protein
MGSDVHPHFERQETTDPITGHTIADTDGHPWVQEGDPDEGLTIFFDSETSMRKYAAIQVERPEHGMHASLDNPLEEGEAEG